MTDNRKLKLRCKASGKLKSEFNQKYDAEFVNYEICFKFKHVQKVIGTSLMNYVVDTISEVKIDDEI